MAKIQMKCKHCGSTEVMRDAWAAWDVEEQEWVLQDVSDQAFCSDCDGESSLIEEKVQ